MDDVNLLFWKKWHLSKKSINGHAYFCVFAEPICCFWLLV